MHAPPSLWLLPKGSSPLCPFVVVSSRSRLPLPILSHSESENLALQTCCVALHLTAESGAAGNNKIANKDFSDTRNGEYHTVALCSFTAVVAVEDVCLAQVAAIEVHVVVIVVISVESEVIGRH